MAKPTVEVVDVASRRGATDGTIIVRPPILRITNLFNQCVLGEFAEGVALQEFFSTRKETVLSASSTRGEDETSRETDLETIAERIGTLLLAPEFARDMMNDSVFPPTE